MQVSKALEILGAKRVIWIDDRFNTTPAQLANQLINSLEIALDCDFPELRDALSTYEFDQIACLDSVTQILTDLTVDRIEEIKLSFSRKEEIEKSFPTTELSTDSIVKTRDLLGIAQDDCWTFERAGRDLPTLCESGDATLSYIVDLNESGGSRTRGMDMLRVLWQGKSNGTAFILTHETDIAGESKIETELRSTLLDLEGLGLPICVIAKERLSDKPDGSNSIADALCIGMKRAGLRRSMHDVLVRARAKIQTAIDDAALSLLSISPEQLESHVFERGYKEGVSELHVVERAITAHIGKEAREFFGADDLVQASAQRYRALRAIELKSAHEAPDPHLQAFREAEIWESDQLLNRALSPIACGDVFELDSEEPATKASRQKFILLGQPCDISLRPEDRVRAQETAFFVPLRNKVGTLGKIDTKAPLLPFPLRDERWACDFRNATSARLSILDLASFRVDGRVRFDEGQSAPPGLLVAQQKVYEDRTLAVSKALGDPKLRPCPGTTTMCLQLTFASTGSFKYIYAPAFEEASRQKTSGVLIERPKRATWRLRRCGRIRMPYATALLDQFTTVMSRPAFLLDYMSHGGLVAEEAGCASEGPAKSTEAVADEIKITLPVKAPPPTPETAG